MAARLDENELLMGRIAQVSQRLLDHVAQGSPLAVIQAPPGSGKTFTLLRAVDHAVALGQRVAVATQTNAQADDICRRLATHHPRVPAVRFASSDATPIPLGPTVAWESKAARLPAGRCAVVGTSAKWGLVDLAAPFDVLFVEEAWQLAWADFMLLHQVAGRFVLIGDPGQIPPVVTIDPARWQTTRRPPHRAAPEVILREDHARLDLALPATWRLPHDTTPLVRRFYDFHFESVARAGERRLRLGAGGPGGADRVIERLCEGSVAALTLPTPDCGPPLERDGEVARAAVGVVERLLARDARIQLDGVERALAPEDIGLCATHRVMNSEMELALPAVLQGRVAVDTPERWQGLQRPLMIVVHPLSGVLRPSAFDLETGRLCVMASRHQVGLVVVGRDHIPETLAGCFPVAEQAPGCPDVCGRGHDQHLGFWSGLETLGGVIAA